MMTWGWKQNVLCTALIEDIHVTDTRHDSLSYHPVFYPIVGALVVGDSQAHCRLMDDPILNFDRNLTKQGTNGTNRHQQDAAAGELIRIVDESIDQPLNQFSQQ